MIDGEVRELGRRARADGDPDARLAWLVARVRAGLPRERLVLAAWAGDPAARALLGKAAPLATGGPLHLAGTQGNEHGSPRPWVVRYRGLRPWIVVMGNAGKLACLDAACDALDAACAASSLGSGGVIAATRAWRSTGDRGAARSAREAIAREAAALLGGARLAYDDVQLAIGEVEPARWRLHPALAVVPAPTLPARALVALTGELLARIASDDRHRFAVLAAVAVRFATAVAPQAPVDAAVRAAVIRFALR